jgi:hypothetical protein
MESKNACGWKQIDIERYPIRAFSGVRCNIQVSRLVKRAFCGHMDDFDPGSVIADVLCCCGRARID